MSDRDQRILTAIERAKSMSAAERAAAEAAQTADLTHAIIEAINTVMARMEVPIGNAVGPALAAAEANWLATLEPNDRKKVKRQLELLRPRYLAQAVRNAPMTTVIKVGVMRFDA
jgi:thymidine phosphorylase